MSLGVIGSNQDPETADLQEATANKREASKCIGNPDDLIKPSSIQKMSLAVRADEESFADPIDTSFSRCGDASEQYQPPFFDALMLEMDATRISSDVEDNSCKGSHSCPMRVVPISSEGIQYPDACSFPSSMEKSHSFGKLFSNDLPDVVDRKSMDAEYDSLPFLVMQAPEHLHRIIQFSDQGGVPQCSINRAEERHPTAGHFTILFADIMRRGINLIDADEPGIVPPSSPFNLLLMKTGGLL
ncbi:hypothetical protein Nepgr_030143 [Nepenthes gracilis]|uniref:Uncharacterized protein n=1 Tax=Nepenthes gracilis TaxID=150966 RepID=A0AAD3TEU9_NEPGR|nr:hypothetical protein Nepgr_030143 [Nepenthes gracilis]